VSAGLRWDNLWGAQHSFGLTVQQASENPAESRAVSLNYTVPFPSGNILALYAVSSKSDVAAVGTLNVIGDGEIYGARYIVPLPSSEGFFHNATFGVDYKDFKQSVNLIGSGGFNTPIHYLPMTVGWDGNLQDAKNTSHLGIALNFHLPGTAGTEQEFADKRFKGRPGYAYIRGNLSTRQTLAQDWVVSARGSWQWADQALVSNEQFSLGGVDTVRGYYESAATGEVGTALSFEVSTPNLAKYLGSEQDLRGAFFVDGGNVRVIDPISATDQFNLASWGLGLHLVAPKGFSATLDWAIALNDIGITRQGDNRLHFRVGYEW
jgi:hemolysin activation/secretion protein